MRSRPARVPLGFIGTGSLGAPIALRLLLGGHPVVAFDTAPAALSQVVAAGGGAASSVGEVVRRSEVVFTCLPSLVAVESVYLGAGGLVASALPGRVLVDLSTVLPGLAGRIHLAAREREVATLDAPVSGGVEGARQGSLTVMVGGEEAVFHQVQPLLERIGSTVLYLGPSGTGCTAKLLNQLFVVVHNAAVAEGMALAARTGVDVRSLVQVVLQSTGRSRALEQRALRMLERDFRAGASIDIVGKDAELVLAFAQELGARVPVATEAKKVYDLAKRQGLGSLDMAALIELYQEADGTAATEGPGS